MSSGLRGNQYIDSFLANLRLEKGLSTNTINAYANDCLSFLKWVNGVEKIDILSIQEDQVQRYIKNFQVQNLASSTINRKISSLKHFRAQKM
jgi:site-specific recombinase XerD